MNHLRKSHLLLPLFLALSGCGGGGSDSSPGPTFPPVVLPPTESEIIADAQSYTPSQLKTAATSLADKQYTGNEQTATVNVAVSQSAMKWLFDTDGTNTPTFFDLNYYDFEGGTTGPVDSTVTCDYGGSVRVAGELSLELQGTLIMTFNNCSDTFENENINGSAAITINKLTENESDVVIYVDNLSYSDYTDQAFMSGYLNEVSIYNPNNGDFTFSQDIYTTVKAKGESALVQLQSSYTSTNNSQNFVISGDIYMFDAGKLSFTSEGLPYPPPYVQTGSLTLAGDKVATFEFNSPHISYLEDSDNDGDMDMGTYFADVNELFIDSAANKTLVDIANMSLPPYVGTPYYYANETPNTTDTITVELGYFDDPDNNIEDLSVSFIWYLNGNIVPEQNSATFPARIAVFEDDLRVSMLVSDGINMVEGTTRQIELADAPLEVTISNIPENVRAGDLINFNAQISDPDDAVSSSNPVSSMVGAPAGATIDENGEVSWQVPNELLFPLQTFSFTFAGGNSEDGSGGNIVVDVDVQSSQGMPLARKGMESPKKNHSIAIGDFNGDGLNEILSTDSVSSIFLLANEQDTYTQIWTYPFKAGTGKVVQVLAANLDNDDELEIVVVSEFSISVIYDLQSMAVELLSSDTYIKFAQIADTNEDGILDIAYLSGADDYFSDDTQLSVVSLDSNTTPLFSVSVENALEIAFGNVDNDSNLELVTNNGLVNDANTWQNQWFSSNVFGTASIALGDFNNDGIDEIAGADQWGNFTVYSVLERAQLASLNDRNTCSLTTANVDTDSAMEIILGDCQWGNVTAYKLSDNQLEQVWSTDNQDHGSISLVSGDSDNDGNPEVHWGTGISHSGADMFAGADLNVSAGTVSPKVRSTTAVQLDSYHSAGWSNVTDNNENAVFYVPSTESGYDGSRLVYMKADGSTTLSSELSSNWDNSSKAITTDFNKDGFGDIFLPLTNLYDGVFGAMQLSNESIHWQTNGDYASDIGLIRAQDINDDGFDDALFVDGNSLKIIDVFNQTILANLSVNDYISDFVVFEVGNEINIVVAQSDKTILYTYNGSVLSEQSFIEQQCSQLLAINNDTDAAAEVLCLTGEQYYYSNDKQAIVIYEVQDKNLVEGQRNILNVRVSALVVDPSASFEQGLFLAAHFPSDNSSWYDENNHFIASATTSGAIIWRSPLLIGNTSQDSLKARMTQNQSLELMFSTTQMMYWIK